MLDMLTSPEIFFPLAKWDFLFLTLYYLPKVYTGANSIPVEQGLDTTFSWVILLSYGFLITAGGYIIGLLPHPAVTLYTGFLRLFFSSLHSSSRTLYFIWSPSLLNTESWKKTHNQLFCLSSSAVTGPFYSTSSWCLRASRAAAQTYVLRFCGCLKENGPQQEWHY